MDSHGDKKQAPTLLYWNNHAVQQALEKMGFEGMSGCPGATRFALAREDASVAPPSAERPAQ